MITASPEERIYCNCCNPPQIMAMRRGSRLVIWAVHHGRKHVAVVEMPLTKEEGYGIPIVVTE